MTLKPCPFCGGAAMLSENGRYASCNGKGCAGWMRTPKWNTRAPIITMPNKTQYSTIISDWCPENDGAWRDEQAALEDKP